MNTGKNCKKCGEFKLWEELVKNKSSNDGYENRCKICCKKHIKQYRINNHAKIKEYYNNNIDKIKQDQKQYRMNNSLKCNEYAKEYRINNPNAAKEWRLNNCNKFKKTVKTWRNNNRDKYNTLQAKRRALKLNQLHPEHNSKIEEVLRQMNKRLENCLKIPFNIDHIIPLNKGGPHHHQNLQVIPASLNFQKHDNMDFKHPLLINPKNILPIFENWMKSSEQFAK